MAIPDFQMMMRPLLELHADGGEKPQGEHRDHTERVDMPVLEQFPGYGEPRIVGSRMPPRGRSWRLSA